jgi:Cof subfamily protein (haloacid dehalogenase superfamily)
MAHLSDFRALLFDVDNTLTSTNKEFFPEVIGALQLLHDQGYVLGTCTGKSAIALQKYIFPQFPPQSYHIVCGGAQIVTNEGEIIWEQTFDQVLVQEMMAALHAVDAKYFVVQPDAIYASNNLLPYLQQHRFGIPSKPIAELPSLKIPLLGVYEIDETKRSVIERFSDRVTAKIMQNHKGSQHSYCDITVAEVNKAVAFQKWCELLQIKPDQVMGFGDSENDLEFLQEVGYAVAMGNASDQIKQVANRTIGHANDKGLSTYLTAILEGAEV